MSECKRCRYFRQQVVGICQAVKLKNYEAVYAYHAKGSNSLCGKSSKLFKPKRWWQKLKRGE